MTMTQSARTPIRILVVEDEIDIQELLVLHLGREGYRVDSVGNGEAALEALRDENAEFALFLLDWMLPGQSGLELTKGIRSDAAFARHARTPILMVTARTEPIDIVVGLEAGADDYVTKPFELPVLMARVRALLRRARPRAATSLIQLGDLTVDADRLEAKCRGEALTLTRSEFKLLLALIESRGRVLTRDQLIDAVQGSGVIVVDRAIDTHVFGLRKKLGTCAEWIETVRGVGYRIKNET